MELKTEWLCECTDESNIEDNGKGQCMIFMQDDGFDVRVQINREM